MGDVSLNTGIRKNHPVYWGDQLHGMGNGRCFTRILKQSLSGGFSTPKWVDFPKWHPLSGGIYRCNLLVDGNQNLGRENQVEVGS